jgi:hypothetical protein
VTRAVPQVVGDAVKERALDEVFRCECEAAGIHVCDECREDLFALFVIESYRLAAENAVEARRRQFLCGSPPADAHGV